MSMTFTKLFSSITESTIWQEPDATRLVWICMLAMADRHGRVWASLPGLAHRARVSLADCEAAITTFLSPDKHSRTAEFEGRRVSAIDGGWLLLNHSKYRAIRDEEAIRESKREHMRRARKRGSDVEKVERGGTPLTAVDRGGANAEADTEATARESDALPPPEPAAPASGPAPASGRTRRPRAKSVKPEAPPPSAPTWIAYAAAYRERYGVEPVRNAKVNGMLCQFVARVGAEAAPLVAAFFVQLNRGLYVAARHAIDLMLRDAEGLHTDWQRGQSVTDHEARALDRTQTNFNAFAPLLRTAQASITITNDGETDETTILTTD